MLHDQYPGCWWPGDSRNQIINHDAYLVLQKAVILYYREISDIRRTLLCNNVVDNSDVVGAASIIFILDYIHRFNRLCKDNCKTRQETSKFWELVRLICDIYLTVYINTYRSITIATDEAAFWEHCFWIMNELISTWKNSERGLYLWSNLKYIRYEFCHDVCWLALPWWLFICSNVLNYI